MKEENEWSIKLAYLLTILAIISLTISAIVLAAKISMTSPQDFKGMLLISKTSQWVMLITSLIALTSYFLGLFLVGKLNKKYLKIEFWNHQTILWFRPKYFRLRFKEKGFLLTLMGVFDLCIVFFIMTSVLLIYISHKNETEIKKHLIPTEYTTIIDSSGQIKLTVDADSLIKEKYIERTSENFIFNLGLPFGLIITLLTVITYLNTEIIKKKGETELYTLSEIYEVLINKMNFTANLVDRCNDGKENDKKEHFYYVIDHSLSLGHISKPNEEDFINFNDSLSRYYCGNNTTIKAILLNDEYLEKNYFVTYKMPEKLDDQVKGSTITLDKLQTYEYKVALNHKGQKTVKVDRDKYGFKPMTNDDYKSYSEMSLSDFELDKISRVLEVTEIGVTRMIITDSFVLSFMSYEIPSKNGKLNKPIAYYSEEILTIEKSKAAFIQAFIRFCSLRNIEINPKQNDIKGGEKNENLLV